MIVGGWSVGKERESERAGAWGHDTGWPVVATGPLAQLPARLVCVRAMAASVLSVLQESHELLEVERTLVLEELKKQPKSIPQIIVQENRVARALTRIAARAKSIEEIYEDKDGSLASLQGVLTGQDVFTSFYERVGALRDLYANHDGTALAVSSADAVTAAQRELFSSHKNEMFQFTGEEHRGRFLDLVVLHRAFVDLSEKAHQKVGTEPFVPLGYLDYLRVCTEMPHLQVLRQNSPQGRFATYARDLLAYLASFWRRSKPLDRSMDASIEVLRARAREASKTNPPAAAPQSVQQGPLPVLEEYQTVEEFLAAAKTSGDANAVVRTMLGARGMKEGGTLQEKAGRLFAAKGLPVGQIPKKYLAGKKRRRGGPGPDQGARVEEESIDVALECIRLYGSELQGHLARTVEFLTRKQTRSYEELMKDLEDEERVDVDAQVKQLSGKADDEKDEDSITHNYNPKGVPLGIDGKPIPYWLFKLHGLDKKFSCEICGNEIYVGPAAFEKHFSQNQHAAGMATLGIPNSGHFHGLTKIAEVVELHEKLKVDMEQERRGVWNPEEDEEFEDSEGNVMSKETYQDLARQGLL